MWMKMHFVKVRWQDVVIEIRPKEKKGAGRVRVVGGA
jgi:hypothetical protein